MSGRKWTAEQEELFRVVAEEGSHVLGEAVAGAGKTTAAVECAARAPGTKKRFVAFNSHIAKELAGRLDGAAEASTLHSLGRMACLRDLPHLSPEVDKDKYGRLVEAAWPALAWRRGAKLMMRPAGRALLDLFEACRVCLADPTDPASARAASDRMNVDYAEDGSGRLEDLLPRLAELWELGQAARTMDFTDMVWLPVVRRLRVERADVLLVDEAQDLSPLQRALAYRAVAADGRMIVLGDRRQSIYAFTGADPTSIPAFEEDLGATPRGIVACPLSVTFRCPTSHVEVANILVPHMRAREGAPEGILATIRPEDLPNLARPGDLVLSRRNAPLLQTALGFLSQGKPFKVVGRDLTSKLLDTLGKATKGADMPCAKLPALMGTWLDRELDRLERRNATDQAIQNVEDTVKCLLELASGHDTTAQLIEFVKTRLSCEDGDQSVVRGSSVHRAKGLEAERVFLIDTDKMPLAFGCRPCGSTGKVFQAACPRCKGRGTRQTEVEREQELNLLYVALTRAKREMYFVGGVPAGIQF